jgi:hypothetical protein
VEVGIDRIKQQQKQNKTGKTKTKNDKKKRKRKKEQQQQQPKKNHQFPWIRSATTFLLAAAKEAAATV